MDSTAFVVSAVAPCYAAPAEGAAPVAEVVRVWLVSTYCAAFALEMAKAEAAKTDPHLRFEGWTAEKVEYAAMTRLPDQVHAWKGDVPSKPVSRKKGR